MKFFEYVVNVVAMLPDAIDPVILQRPLRRESLASDHLLRACVPIGEGRGSGFVETDLVQPLALALPRFEVRTDIALAGTFQGGDWTARSGHLFGRFEAALFGIPPTGRIAYLRFGCFERWQDGQVAETLLLLDLPALMMQAGVWPLAPAMGPSLMAPGPRGGIGPGDAERGPESLALVEAMIGGLMQFDGQDLGSMGMSAYWTKDFAWYGPAPIGNFRGHRDYERGHQQPFLTAFPDRVGGNHRARIGEGRFVASTGWPSITATHNGGGWLGLAPTARAVTMRVMDFWRAEDCQGSTRLAENWVMIDIPDILDQIGVDVFARVAALTDRS